MNFGGSQTLDITWTSDGSAWFLLSILYKGKENGAACLNFIWCFLNICGLTLLKYLHKKDWKLVENVPVCLLWWRRHLLVRMQERWYDCSARLCPDHAGIWISDRLVPAHWRRITANRWSAVAVGDTSARIYLGSVNINLLLIEIVLTTISIRTIT